MGAVSSALVPLWRRLAAEFAGSAFLAAVVIGSGIAAQRLSPGETGLELLENAAATAAGLFAIILMFGPVSGGHFNPVVSFVDAAFGGLRWRDAAAYLPVQVAGCIAGAVIANLAQERRDRQAHRHRRHRDLPPHDRGRPQRPGPVLHPAAGQPLGRHPDGRPGLGPGYPAALAAQASSRGTTM
jgi:Major intrinsic protein